MVWFLFIVEFFEFSIVSTCPCYISIVDVAVDKGKVNIFQTFLI